jgi:hypothetical protein
MTILRALFFLLVLGNLLFFAWGQGLFGKSDDGREPKRLKDQLQPDSLRIVASAPAPGATAVPAAPAAAPAPPPAPAIQAAAPGPAACRLVAGLSLAEAEKLRAALAATAGLTAVVKPEAETASYWVLVPPQTSRAAAIKKVAELKQRGVTDSYVVTDEGPHQFAISLALFKTEPAAEDFLARLAKKGVKSARIEPQQKAPERAQVEVRGAANILSKGLAGQPAAAVAECPAS